jgi:hypothetical protein
MFLNVLLLTTFRKNNDLPLLQFTRSDFKYNIRINCKAKKSVLTFYLLYALI